MYKKSLLLEIQIKMQWKIQMVSKWSNQAWASSISSKRTVENRMTKKHILTLPTGNRVPPAEVLRTACHSILSRLLRQASKLSKAYLRSMIRTTQLHELIEFFHAFVGFCVDPSSLLSPLSKYHNPTSSYLTKQPLNIHTKRPGIILVTHPSLATISFSKELWYYTKATVIFRKLLRSGFVHTK